MIRLQERDFNLLKSLNNFCILSTSQIARFIFAEIAQTIVLRRLRALSDAGLIINCGHLKTSEKAWSLAKEGGKLIGIDAVYRFSNQNTMLHDVCLSELRMCFESINLAENWTSEFELKRLATLDNQAFIPDGVFTANVLGKDLVVSFELELYAKSHKRYRKLLQEYYYKDSIGMIWYVVKDVSIIKPVLLQWQALKANKFRKPSQELIFSVYDDILKHKNKAKIIFENLETKLLIDAFHIKKSDQGLSSLESDSLSISQDINSKGKQIVGSDSNLEMEVPSALDPSPTTL